MNDSVLKLGIPAGSLQEATARLFARAGYQITFAGAVTIRPLTTPRFTAH